MTHAGCSQCLTTGAGAGAASAARGRFGARAGIGLFALAGLGSPTAWAAPEGPSVVWVGRFSDGAGPWREVTVNPKLTRNRFELREWDGVPAIEVQSRSSMSLYARPIAVDLAATPVLCWRWRVDAPLVSADLLTRAGDDYAARVYVSLSVPPEQQSLGLRAQLKVARAIWGADVPDAALNYVWDNRQAIGTTRANAYTDRAMMVVLRTGSSDAGRWVHERRDVGADAVKHYGANVSAVQLAVTADTDNTGEEAHAGFADLHFVTRGTPCRRTGEGRNTDGHAPEPRSVESKGSDAAR